MKLIIQIPCLNEETTLPKVLDSIPRWIDKVDQVEILVIDDGSTDRTSGVAREHGVEHLLRFPRTRGLARAFAAGIHQCLVLGADLIVNIDGDWQYRGEEIPQLIAPILAGRAEMVIGDRQLTHIRGLSPRSRLKRQLQRLGSSAVRFFSNTDVRDATSGFRAYSRDAALRLNVFSDYTYTIETIIEAGHRRAAIAQIPVRTNPQTRPSRLISSIRRYVGISVKTMVYAYSRYHPLRIFAPVGLLVCLLGCGVGGWFAYTCWQNAAASHLYLLVLAAMLVFTGISLGMMGLLAHLIGVNRMHCEEILFRLRAARLEGAGSAVSPSDHRKESADESKGDRVAPMPQRVIDVEGLLRNGL